MLYFCDGRTWATHRLPNNNKLFPQLCIDVWKKSPSACFEPWAWTVMALFIFPYKNKSSSLNNISVKQETFLPLWVPLRDLWKPPVESPEPLLYTYTAHTWFLEAVSISTWSNEDQTVSLFLLHLTWGAQYGSCQRCFIILAQGNCQYNLGFVLHGQISWWV